jgi:hypothetical protein
MTREHRAYPERSTAMLRGFGGPLDRASRVGGVVAAASAAVLSVALASSVWPLVVPIVGAVLGTIIGLAIARLLIPNPLMRAYEAFSWLGRAEIDRWVSRTDTKVPVKRPNMERWLDDHPASSAFRLSRIELLAFLGRLDEARTELEDVVATSPDLALERAILVRYIGWLTDGDARLVEFRAMLAELTLDGDQRRVADVTLAVADARDRYMRADPAWWRPLEGVRASLGGAAGRMIRRDTMRPLAILYLSIGVIAGSVASLLRVLLWGLP